MGDTSSLRQRTTYEKNDGVSNSVVNDDVDEKTVKIDPKTGKRYKRRKDLPSVAYLLAHGDPETAHLPKTWAQTIGYPLALAVIFAISLLLFHYAPHEKSTHKGFSLPKRMQPKPIRQQRKQVHTGVPPQSQKQAPKALDPDEKD